MSIDEATMKLGQEGYALCLACHGADGNGQASIGPPLSGSEWVLGPVENVIRMQFRGLQGPITVKGEEWNLIMAPMGPAMIGDENHTADEKLAATLTFIRNSWGNEASEVTPEQVAKYRDEIGQPMLTVADLVDPTAPPEVAPESNTTTNEVISVSPLSSLIPTKNIKEAPGNTLGLIAGVGFIAWCAISLIPVLGGFFKRKK